MDRNVPGWERILRGAAALGLIVGGVLWAINGGSVTGWIVAASGAGFGITALVGWCPACALVGRKLPKVDKKIPVIKL